VVTLGTGRPPEDRDIPMRWSLPRTRTRSTIFAPRMVQFPTIRACRSWWAILMLILAVAARAQGGTSLAVTVILNEPDAGGVLHIAYCPDKHAYDTEEGCTVLDVEATGRTVTGTFQDLAPGPCAVKVFHDINRDGKLNTSWIGWPQEPYGFSNDAPVNMGPPSYKLAMITLTEGPNQARIALR